jgi:hypothetical protein
MFVSWQFVYEFLITWCTYVELFWSGLYHLINLIVENYYSCYWYNDYLFLVFAPFNFNQEALYD